jgi:hypothetical protein
MVDDEDLSKRFTCVRDRRGERIGLTCVPMQRRE